MAVRAKLKEADEHRKNPAPPTITTDEQELQTQAPLPQAQRTHCFTDVAFHHQYLQDKKIRTWLGVVLCNSSGPITPAIEVKAVTTQANTPLQAEAAALLLTSKINKALGHTTIDYISDNQTMVATLHKDDYITDPGDWRLRPLLYEFRANNEHIDYQVHKINRTYNT